VPEENQLEVLCRVLRGKVAIIGIGNEMRGDDAVGCYVARCLEGVEDMLVVEAGDVPENYVGLLREYKPECVVFIDAVDVGAEPGSIVIASADELPSSAVVSTHGMPLKLLSDYLLREVGARVMLIGIQVRGTALNAPISKEVCEAAEAIAKLIRSARLAMRA